MIPVHETLIDVPAVAQRFCVSMRTVRRWFRSGLEYGKFGGRVLTSLEALDRFQGRDERAEIIRDLKDRFGVVMERSNGRKQAGEVMSAVRKSKAV